MLINKDIKTSSHDFNNNIIEVTSIKKPSNSFKRLLKAANNKVNN